MLHWFAEKDSCGGDSGGPLVTMKKVGAHIVYTVIGITSWGPTLCGAKKDEYGIYTNVAYFNDWILNNISWSIESYGNITTEFYWNIQKSLLMI